MIDQKSPWSDAELDEAVWQLSNEYTHASMLVYSHAVEHGRNHVPAGSPQSLLAAMRESLRNDPALKLAPPHFRPEQLIGVVS